MLSNQVLEENTELNVLARQVIPEANTTIHFIACLYTHLYLHANPERQALAQAKTEKLQNHMLSVNSAHVQSEDKTVSAFQRRNLSSPFWLASAGLVEGIRTQTIPRLSAHCRFGLFINVS